MSIKSEQKGIMLTEALVSIAMLITATLVLSSIITNAVSTTKLSRDYMLSQNLGTESVEAVKNRRSTNWLLSIDNTDWLCINDACSAKVQNGSNYVTTLVNGKWNLVPVPVADLDLAGGDAPEDYRLCVVEGQYKSGPCLGDTKSPFFRSVKFIDVQADSAKYVVKVEWKDGARFRNIERTITLHNFRD